MERRKFVKTLSWAMASGMVLGARKLMGSPSLLPILPGVPKPPGPPPPTADPKFDPPYAFEMPSIPFDAPPGSWTLVVLPDTQDMASDVPEEYTRQTEWIVAHRERHNILFVAHEGDLVNVNDHTEQWINAQTSMRKLSDAGIPYCILPGNHDQESMGNNHRFTHLSDYFTPEDYRHSEAFGLFEPGRMENSWHEFTAPTGKYLVVALEFGPRTAALDWANGIVESKPDHKVIVVVHSHLWADGSRYNWAVKGASQGASLHSYPLGFDSDSNDGEDVWNKLLKKHRNIFMVLCGHDIDGKGTGYLISEGDHGQRVHQILANYQFLVWPHRPYKGGGYLRLMQFHPDGKTIAVKSYSPWLDAWLRTPDQQFTVTV